MSSLYGNEAGEVVYKNAPNKFMITLWHGNTFRITGPLRGETTSDRYSKAVISDNIWLLLDSPVIREGLKQIISKSWFMII